MNHVGFGDLMFHPPACQLECGQSDVHGELSIRRFENSLQIDLWELWYLDMGTFSKQLAKH